MKIKTLVLLLGALAASVRSALALPLGGSLSAAVSITASDGTTASDAHSTSWSAAPAALQVNTYADGISGAVFDQGSASWNPDGNEGSLALSYGWGLGDAKSVRTDAAAPDWSYSFTADATENFLMDYSVSVGYGPDDIGLQGFTLNENFDSGSGFPALIANNQSTGGMFTGHVTKGNAYTVSLSNNGNIKGDSITTLADPTIFGDFQWSLNNENTIPDGGSTLLLVGGALAGLLFADRFRRAPAEAASRP